jgi:ADP-ribosylation factor GTPase-activating protein 2/3
MSRTATYILTYSLRYVSTVVKRIRHGRQSLSACIYVWTALRIIETWVSTSPLSDLRISMVGITFFTTRSHKYSYSLVWQWAQLRTMKVGGNESATKFFQMNGGSAALASKDAKVKYTSNAANKYKEELKRRAERDAQDYPDEVVITDDSTATPADGTSTPNSEPAGDDFFSSWDKPTIKRPSNPPSRTGTPPVVSRTASPFLSAGGQANGRPKSPSPLAGTSTDSAAVKDAENALPAPTAIRTTSSSAIRKTGALGGAGGAKRNVLSGKKPAQKLGAKRVTEDIDFEAAEKAAKAEAERIEKLGYDPDAEQAEEAAKAKTTTFGSNLATTATKEPAAVNTSVRSTSNPSHARSPSEVERLGMGMNRLGFGMVGPNKSSTSSASAPKKLGFGAVGAAKAAPVEGPSRIPLSSQNPCRT